jgi:putative membrane protein
MKIIKIILVIALVLIALALGAQNQQVVSFNYLLAKGDFHLSLLLGWMFVVGFGIAALVFGSVQFKQKLTIRKLRKQLNNQPAIEKQQSNA